MAKRHEAESPTGTWLMGKKATTLNLYPSSVVGGHNSPIVHPVHLSKLESTWRLECGNNIFIEGW